MTATPANKTPIMRTVLLAFALLFSSSILAQDCEGQHTFTVVIQPDAWPYEMSWELTNGDGDLLLETNVANADDTLFTFCVDSAATARATPSTVRRVGRATRPSDWSWEATP